MSNEKAPEPVSSPLWNISLFGKLRVTSRRGLLDKFPTQKTGSLLALLAFQRGNRVSREEAIEILWPDAEPAAARDRLSQALVWLRRELEFDDVARGSVLVADRFTISVNPAALTTDVFEFTKSLASARQAATPESRIEWIERAVGVYAGDLLVGHYDDWVLTARHALTSDYVAGLFEIVAHYERIGEYPRALSAAQRAVIADELREESHAHVIRLLALTGQKAAALRQFEHLRRLLAKDLDTTPSSATSALAAGIREAKPADTKRVAGEKEQAVAPALPSPLTRLFGRERDLEDVCAQLMSGTVRLLTLTGAGGSGKTRLALAVGKWLRQSASMRVAFVPVADVGDAQLMLSAIAAALQLPDAAASGRAIFDQLAEALSDSTSFLLILDNLEHVIEGVAPVVRGLLDRIPGLAILATSRQRLGLDGEREAPVPPLPIPPPEATVGELLQSASVALFVDRAVAVRPGFAINASNATTIAAICTRLEGIPLAIELCAAWAQTLTPQQMLEKLDRRFELLVSRRLDITPRHRTLRAAVEYGYLQLPKDLQRLFTRLSVFRGGWDLESAFNVCSEAEGQNSFATLGALTELRERSLILADEIENRNGAAEMRYRMLETLREFGAEQLTYADRAARRRSHAAYFLEMAEESERHISGAEQKQWLTFLDGEKENFRSALGWAVENGEIEIGLRLASALGSYWTIRGPLAEAYDWLKQLLDLLDATPNSLQSVTSKVLSRAWRTLGHLAWSQANYTIAREAHSTALALRREECDAAAIAESLYHLGITAYRQDDYDAARPFLEESLILARSQNDEASIARVLLNLGNIAYGEQRLADGLALLQQGLEIFDRLGDPQRVADIKNNMGLIALAMHDNPRAIALFEDSLEIYRRLTNHNGSAVVLANLGTVTRVIGDFVAARLYLSAGLRIASNYGNRFIMIHYFLQLGILEATEKNLKRSVLLMSAAEHLSGVIDGERRMDDADGYQDALRSCREQLGDREFERIWERGRTRPTPEIVGIALAPQSDEVIV